MRRLVLFLCLLVATCLTEGPAARAVSIQQVTAGGIDAWLVEDHTNPIIAVSLAFRGGAALDPPDKAGTARMTAAMLDEGAGDLDSASFQQRLDDLSIHLGFSADLDAVDGAMETLTRNRDEAFALLRLALTQPRFDTDAVNRVRTQMQASLRGDADDPEFRAVREFWARAFAGHPYARPAEGTPDSLERIDAADLRHFAADRLARDQLVLGVVGDITAAELVPLLAKTFADLPEHAAPATVADAVPATAGLDAVIAIDVPQSTIVFGQPGLKRDDPRWYTQLVMSQVLGGGGLTSRLFAEVREARGLAYSVYAAPQPLDHAALIAGSAATANARVAETVDVIRAEWQRAASDGFTPTEVADAKAFLNGSFPLRFSGSRRLAGLLVRVQLDRLGIDYLQRREQLIEGVSADDVNALAHSLLNVRQLGFVVAGSPPTASR